MNIRISIALSLLCYFSTFSSPSFAQSKSGIEQKNAEVKVAPAKANLQTMETMSFYPNDVEYPKNLSSTGVQGRVIVSAMLQTDGSLKQAMILDSSRSLALDLAAINVIQSLQYQLAQPLQVKEGVAVQIPVEFKKDSYANIHQKSCAEFNQDFSYLRSTFSDQKIDELEVFKIPLGSIFLFLSDAQKAKFHKNASTIRAATVLSCNNNPSQNLMSVMKDIVKRSLSAS